MPELPDVVVYVERLAALAVGERLRRISIRGPFVLRSVDPAPESLEGEPLEAVRRLGKRIVMVFPEKRYLVIHLMIAGRLRWREPGRYPAGKIELVAFEFDSGTLVLTEAGTKKRAALYVVAGEAALATHDRGGLEVLESSIETFTTRLRSERHTLKRALTDPRLFSGIGNAYSDEILHRAKLSPLKWSTRLDDAEVERLHAAMCGVLSEWTDRLRKEAGAGFPGKVTAFRPEMCVHGKFGGPCPVCGATVQRIVYTASELNYCPGCQTGGKVLADRSLSRLLRGDW